MTWKLDGTYFENCNCLGMPMCLFQLHQPSQLRSVPPRPDLQRPRR
jgi:hypothetical protein